MVLTPRGTATLNRIIEGAVLEIRERGLRDLTLDDIRRRSSTSKSQLFHYFPGGREELLLAVASHESARVLLDQQPFLDHLTTPSSWRAWRDAVVDRYRLQGVHCPLGMLITEIGRTSPAARAITADLLEVWEARLREGIAATQNASGGPGAVDPSRGAATLVSAIQGGVVILMSTGSSIHLETSLTTLLDAFELCPTALLTQ